MNKILAYVSKHFSICDNINAIKYNYNNKYSQSKWQMCINSKSCFIIYSFSSQSSSTSASTSSNLLNFFDLFPSSSSSAFYFIMFTFNTNSFTSNTFDFWHLKVEAQHSLQSLCQIVLHIFFLFTILPSLKILKIK